MKGLLLQEDLIQKGSYHENLYSITLTPMLSINRFWRGPGIAEVNSSEIPEKGYPRENRITVSA